MLFLTEPADAGHTVV